MKVKTSVGIGKQANPTVNSTGNADADIIEPVAGEQQQNQGDDDIMSAEEEAAHFESLVKEGINDGVGSVGKASDMARQMGSKQRQKKQAHDEAADDPIVSDDADEQPEASDDDDITNLIPKKKVVEDAAVTEEDADAFAGKPVSHLRNAYKQTKVLLTEANKKLDAMKKEAESLRSSAVRKDPMKHPAVVDIYGKINGKIDETLGIYPDMDKSQLISASKLALQLGKPGEDGYRERYNKVRDYISELSPEFASKVDGIMKQVREIAGLSLEGQNIVQEYESNAEKFERDEGKKNRIKMSKELEAEAAKVFELPEGYDDTDKTDIKVFLSEFIGGLDQGLQKKLKTSVVGRVKEMLLPEPIKTIDDYPDLAPDEAEVQIKKDRERWVGMQKGRPELIASGIIAINAMRTILPEYIELKSKLELERKGRMKKPGAVSDNGKNGAGADDDDRIESDREINEMIYGKR